MSTKDDIQFALNSLFDESGRKRSELADYLGVSRAAVSNWLTGNNSIDMELIPGICDFFHISVDEFFGRREINRMSTDEQELLSLYRKMNERGRSRLMEEAVMMANSGMFAKSEDNKVPKSA